MVGTVNSFPGAFGPGSVQQLREGAGARSAGIDAGLSEASSQGIRDTVSVSQGVGGDRTDVVRSRTGLDLAIGAGRQALSVLAEISDLASRAAQPETPDEVRVAQDQTLRGLTTRLREIVDGAIAAGARALAGESVAVSDTAQVSGLDLRMGAEQSVLRFGDAMSIATLDTARASAADSRESFSKVSVGIARLEEAAAGFDVHLGALAALDKSLAAKVQTSFNEESARMIALQVRQTLSGLDQPVVNGNGGILSHFRV